LEDVLPVLSPLVAIAKSGECGLSRKVWKSGARIEWFAETGTKRWVSAVSGRENGGRSAAIAKDRVGERRKNNMK
jgi:hypothetical protein